MACDKSHYQFEHWKSQVNCITPRCGGGCVCVLLVNSLPSPPANLCVWVNCGERESSYFRTDSLKVNEKEKSLERERESLSALAHSALLTCNQISTALAFYQVYQINVSNCMSYSTNGHEEKERKSTSLRTNRLLSLVSLRREEAKSIYWSITFFVSLMLLERRRRRERAKWISHASLSFSVCVPVSVRLSSHFHSFTLALRCHIALTRKRWTASRSK